MKSLTQLYDAAVQYATKQIASLVIPIALTLDTPADISLEQMLPQTVQLPPDPTSPAYQRQMEIWRFHGKRDMDAQMESFDRNATYTRR
jgi:hypothetical protein